MEQLNKLIELHTQQNNKLDRITAILVGDQLLTECVDHQGSQRTPEECVDIVGEGYSAALCMLETLDQKDKEYQYQKQEFFIEEEE